MTYDVLRDRLDGNKFTATGKDKEAVLDDNDELWVHTRYMHIAHVTDVLKKGTEDLLKSSVKKSSGSVRINTHTYTLTQTHTHTHTHTHIHTYIHTHIHTHTNSCTRAY